MCKELKEKLESEDKMSRTDDILEGLREPTWKGCDNCKQLQAKLSMYEKDAHDLIVEHGADPSDKIDREVLKEMLNSLIGKIKQLQAENEKLMNLIETVAQWDGYTLEQMLLLKGKKK